MSADPADISAFLAVAETRNFRKAAALRGVSASSMSEAVRRLEARMNTRLLNRTTRSVTPTEAGERLIARAKPALAELEAAAFDAAATGARLRLNVPGIVAEAILPDILGRFMAANPDVQVEVAVDNTFVDVLAAGFDAGIRYGESLDSDMIAVPIGPRVQRMATVAAPAYLASAGIPTHPDDLSHHRLIRMRFASGVMHAWEFRKAEEFHRISGEAMLIAGNATLMLAAALAGQGILHSFEEFLAEPLAKGHLVEILADWCDPFPGPYLYFPSRRHMPQGLRRFLDFLRTDRASESPG